jgi:hypothetical protein
MDSIFVAKQFSIVITNGAGRYINDDKFQDYFRSEAKGN